MQFFGFKPERASLRFQFRYCSKDHPEKVLGFARFLFLFRDRVVGFDVVALTLVAAPTSWLMIRYVTACCGIAFAKSMTASANRAVRSSKS